MAERLTDAFLQAQRPPATGRIELADTREPGLVFRVTAAGARSWSFRYRNPVTGKLTRATIGAYPKVTLKEARAEAVELRKQVGRRENPNLVRRQLRDTAASRTFGAVSARYLTEYAEREKAARSAKEDRRLLDKHILPKWQARRAGVVDTFGGWRERPIDAIRRADAIELVEGLIAAGKPTLANRVHALASKVFTFAIDSDICENNPFLKLAKRGAESVRSRVLTDREIRLFWHGVTRAPVSRPIGLALRLVLVTVLRPGEVAALERPEIEALDDPARALVRLRAARLKRTRKRSRAPPRDQVQPLSALARALVIEACELAGDSGHLFPARSRPGAISEGALAKAMRRFVENLDPGSDPAAATLQADRPTPHDLRRTGSTRLRGLRVPSEVRDAILGHTPKTVRGIHYEWHDATPEVREALDAWAGVLAAIVAD
jgi:integrase